MEASMSKLTDRIKAAVTPDDDAAKIDAAIAAKHAAVDRGKDREGKIAAASLAQQTAERAYELATAQADGPDDPALAKLRRDLDKATANLDFLRTALKGDRRAIEEADQALHVLGRDKHTKTFRRKTGERTKRADRLDAALKEYVAAIFDFYEITAEIGAAFPFGVLPGGCIATRTDVFDLVAKEISRLNPVDPINTGTLKIPGAFNNPMVNARNFPPLKDTVAQANAHLLRVIEKGPAPSVLPVEAKPAPAVQFAPDDADDAILNPPTPTGPRLDASQIMAALPHRRLS
jgi:hypothetical protein